LLLGVDLGGTDVKYGIVTADGRVVDQAKIRTQSQEGAEAVLLRIARALDEILAKNSLARADIRAIGFGSPGPLSTRRGVVIDTPNLGWVNVPVQAVIEREMAPLRMILHNDGNAAAYGEFWKGAGRGAEIMVLFTLGTGVGGGICMANLAGHLLVGPGENAAELGHMVLETTNGKRCPCGGTGHLEAYSSAKAALRDALEAIDRGEPTALRDIPRDVLSARRIFETAQKGDALARRIFQQVGWYLGVASGTLVNVLNAEMFVFGGAMSGAWEVLEPAILEGARFAAMAMPFDSIQFVRAQLGNDAGLIGAAGLAYKAFCT
jgi:glucokinase